MKEEEGFLRRWSERKRAAREGAGMAEAEIPAPAAAEEVSEPAAVEPAPEPDALTPEEVAALPPVESVNDLVELRRFLAKGVPDLLRRAALRRIWLLDPRIRDHVDVALDYAYDWNTPGGVPGSGALVSRANVARMADALFPKEPDRKETGAAVAPTEPPRPSVAETPPAAVEAAPVVAEAPSDPPPAAEPPPSPEQAGRGERAARPRRGHGGARPV